ncbi:hypothetical protein BDQ17DRAFT_271531 [Cyathus striatus]|nr:hypothetical protein BDQ17DRAFT_271531 [Cyathus striatus]
MRSVLLSVASVVLGAFNSVVCCLTQSILMRWIAFFGSPLKSRPLLCRLPLCTPWNSFLPQPRVPISRRSARAIRCYLPRSPMVSVVLTCLTVSLRTLPAIVSFLLLPCLPALHTILRMPTLVLLVLDVIVIVLILVPLLNR